MATWALVAVLGLIGCGDGGQVGGQTGEEMPAPCLEERRQVALLEVPVGMDFSAADLRSRIAGPHQEPFVWADGGATTLTLSVGEHVARAEHVDSRRNPVFQGDFECPDRLELAVRLRLLTSDGLDWEIDATLSASEVDEATLYTRVPAGEQTRVRDHAPEGVAEPDAVISGGITVAGSWGFIDGETPEGALEPTVFPVGSWGEAPAVE